MGDDSDRRRARDAAEHAARYALERVAHDEAAGWYQRSIGFHDSCPARTTRAESS